jgi:hypothetical protein
MSTSYQPLPDSQKRKPEPRTLDNHPASSNVDPAFLEWARNKEMVRPGEDGTLPAMDQGGFGILSMAWGGPMQTGEASVQEKRDMKERRHLDRAMGHGEARVVGGNDYGSVDVKQDAPRERKRDKFRKLFSDDVHKKRLERTMRN